MHRLVAVALLCVLGCGGAPLTGDRHAQAQGMGKARTRGQHGSEATKEAPDPERVSDAGKQWGGWRYSGARDECYFLVGRKCFATEAAACKAAKCGRKRCDTSGAGPATVTCR